MDKRDTIEHNETRDLNRDPLTGTPGSHPVGVGVGGVGGAAAGAVIGALGGPLGMLIGGGIGTLVGAAAGKGVAERIDPTGEAEFWRESYTSRPYHDARFDYENDYAPAYGYGVDARNRLPERTWDESLERELGVGWGQVRGEFGSCVASAAGGGHSESPGQQSSSQAPIDGQATDRKLLI